MHAPPDAIRTHQRIDAELVGTPEQLGPGYARVRLVASERMAADEHGLVHGGFVFGLADYAAMLAVNEPTVVLAGGSLSFRAPAVVGQTLVAEARCQEAQGRRVTVAVTVRCDQALVADGELRCVILERHVLAARPAPARRGA